MFTIMRTLHDWCRFVRPIYPPQCTDDFEFIHQNNCTELRWPMHLKRDE